ncbi:hypothetical protein J6590_107525 [Homalodisca vitripennis]|nr:hypothetical protein J6590_107525 [Homalodisca vitripennis]
MWNKVNVGFNVEEETANFGTRACAVNDVAVYETNTLAAIHAGDEVTGTPGLTRERLAPQLLTVQLTVFIH